MYELKDWYRHLSQQHSVEMFYVFTLLIVQLTTDIFLLSRAFVCRQTIVHETDLRECEIWHVFLVLTNGLLVFRE